MLFRAVDQSTGRQVAIKVFDPQKVADTYRYECFKREAEMLSRLSGEPDIIECVSPLATFTQQLPHGGVSYPLEFSYYGMELGESDLATALSTGSLTPEEKLDAFHVMCRAVQRLHSKRIAHRDLKPVNFLLLPDATLKLADFGSARDLGPRGKQILVVYGGRWPGDKRYTSPALLAGLLDADQGICYHADLYSLGAILYEMFSGTHLFSVLFTQSFLIDIESFNREPDPRKRLHGYQQRIESLAGSLRYPSLQTQGSAPGSVRRRIEDLYRALAAVDYRQRPVDFGSVFRQLDICRLVLRNEAKYQRWLHHKRERRRNKNSATQPGALEQQ